MCCIYLLRTDIVAQYSISANNTSPAIFWKGVCTNINISCVKTNDFVPLSCVLLLSETTYRKSEEYNYSGFFYLEIIHGLHTMLHKYHIDYQCAAANHVMHYMFDPINKHSHSLTCTIGFSKQPAKICVYLSSCRVVELQWYNLSLHASSASIIYCRCCSPPGAAPASTHLHIHPAQRDTYRNIIATSQPTALHHQYEEQQAGPGSLTAPALL